VLTEFESLVHLQRHVAEAHASNRTFGTKVGNAYTWITYAEFGEQVDHARAALAALGVAKDDKVAVIANNRVEWAVAAYATYSLGAQFVPMYEAQLEKDWLYILNDASAKVLLTATDEIYQRTKGFTDTVESLAHVLCFDAAEGSSHSWAAHLQAGAAAPVPPHMPTTTDIAGLIYTSGTTGNPKGVVLSHGNFCSNVNAVNSVFPLQDDDCSCSFLPWAHSFGQTAELHCMVSRGAAIGIAGGVTTLLEDFLLVRPTVLFSVPRVFNKIYDGLNKRMAAESPIKRALFHRTMAVAEQRRDLLHKGQQSWWVDKQYAVLDKLVSSKVRDRFGGRLKYAFSGGAALQKEVGEFIDNVGIIVFEGYGLTETSPIASANNPTARKFGTIGVPIPGVEVYICDEQQNILPDGQDGEIVVVGPNVMQGYHNLPEQTAEVIFDLDGKRAFRTGDMGRIDEEGFIKIVGRFKEQYKLENGKYVVPTPLEDQLRLSGYINQCFLYGDNRPYNVLLVVPDFEACASWAKDHGATDTSPEALAKHPGLHDLIGRELQTHSAEFKGYEKPKKWALLADEFTTDNGLLTPKMSVKRRLVVEQYRATLDRLYEA
jgi:long-chain acyl-CoA synthetase